MPVGRLFTSEALQNRTEIALQDEEFHHATHVLRLRVGEPFELVNGQNVCAEAVVAKILKKELIAQITKLTHYPKPSCEVILAQALPRLARLDFIVEKGTELGMTQLWLFSGDRSERADLSPTQQKRLHTLMVSALKQCGRYDLPQLLLKPALIQWKEFPQQTFYGDLQPNAPWLAHALPKNATELCLVIGPESGLSEREVAHLKALHATGVKLHQNILRTDTAALVGLSLLQQGVL